MRTATTPDDISQLPPLIDLATAARLLQIEPSLAKQYVRFGVWPTQVIEVRQLVLVPTASVLVLKGLQPDATYGNRAFPLTSAPNLMSPS